MKNPSAVDEVVFAFVTITVFFHFSKNQLNAIVSETVFQSQNASNPLTTRGFASDLAVSLQF